MALTSAQRTKVILAALATAAAIATALIGLFATGFIGGDSNTCSGTAACGRNNTVTTNGDPATPSGGAGG
ncbi:hypothetical protein ACIRBX_26090 [Kitasatospora sp. NPDC096147]|uniref:hypothetical protein n=1 Tax=Kitasatospora sp. NPDC096147 TaxID=3364093 RepID=UPI0038218EAC